MNKIHKLFSIFIIAVLISSCHHDDDSSAPLRDYQVQYNADLLQIETFLKTHSFTVLPHPGFADDQDVTFTDVPENDPTAIINNPQLAYRMVTSNDVQYKLYYLKIREGGGADTSNPQPYPCNVDNVLASYSGTYLYNLVTTNTDGTTTTSLENLIFETNPFPQAELSLETAVRGWSEIMPQFRAGDHTEVAGQPTLYSDFGAGIMFIPSGLGYYNVAQTGLPAYSPMIFTFKLYHVTRNDQDADGIDSFDEDLDHDRYIYYYTDNITDDTDGDGIPDYRDVDDDDDHTLTKTELLNETTVTPTDDYFNYQTVPDCSGNTTDPNRKRRYLDPLCPSTPQ